MNANREIFTNDELAIEWLKSLGRTGSLLAERLANKEVRLPGVQDSFKTGVLCYFVRTSHGDGRTRMRVDSPALVLVDFAVVTGRRCEIYIRESSDPALVGPHLIASRVGRILIRN